MTNNPVPQAAPETPATTTRTTSVNFINSTSASPGATPECARQSASNLEPCPATALSDQERFEAAMRVARRDLENALKAIKQAVFPGLPVSATAADYSEALASGDTPPGMRGIDGAKRILARRPEPPDTLKLAFIFGITGAEHFGNCMYTDAEWTHVASGGSGISTCERTDEWLRLIKPRVTDREEQANRQLTNPAAAS